MKRRLTNPGPAISTSSNTPASLGPRDAEMDSATERGGRPRDLASERAALHW